MDSRPNYTIWCYTVFGWKRYEAATRKAAVRDVTYACCRAYAIDKEGIVVCKNYGPDHTVSSENWDR